MSYKLEVIRDAYKKAVGNNAKNIASYMRQILKNTPKNRVNTIKPQENQSLKNNKSNVEVKNQVIDKNVDIKVIPINNGSDSPKKSRDTLIFDFMEAHNIECVETAPNEMKNIMNIMLRCSEYEDLSLT